MIVRKGDVFVMNTTTVWRVDEVLRDVAEVSNVETGAKATIPLDQFPNMRRLDFSWIEFVGQVA